MMCFFKLKLPPKAHTQDERQHLFFMWRQTTCHVNLYSMCFSKSSLYWGRFSFFKKVNGSCMGDCCSGLHILHRPPFWGTCKYPMRRQQWKKTSCSCCWSCHFTSMLLTSSIYHQDCKYNIHIIHISTSKHVHEYFSFTAKWWDLSFYPLN